MTDPFDAPLFRRLWERHWILEGRTLRRATSGREFIEWCMRVGGVTQRIDVTEFPDGTKVSTVFLSTDHNHSGHGDPVLFETMVFDGKGKATGYQERCCTYDEAELMHALACATVRHRMVTQ